MDPVIAFEQWLAKAPTEILEELVTRPAMSMEDYRFRLGRISAFKEVIEQLEALKRR